MKTETDPDYRWGKGDTFTVPTGLYPNRVHAVVGVDSDNFGENQVLQTKNPDNSGDNIWFRADVCRLEVSAGPTDEEIRSAKEDLQQIAEDLDVVTWRYKVYKDSSIFHDPSQAKEATIWHWRAVRSDGKWEDGSTKAMSRVAAIERARNYIAYNKREYEAFQVKERTPWVLFGSVEDDEIAKETEIA